MRILICDDDPLMVEEIKKNIEQYFKRNKISCPDIACYTSGEDMLADTGDKDIVFIDVEMPGINGIELGNKLKKLSKNTIIFVVTAYPDYLDDAMRFNVFRYLTKPIDKKRFARNMKEAIDAYNGMTLNIPIETKDGLYTVSASDIVLIEAEGRTVTVYTTEWKRVSVKTMDYWNEILPKNKFFRTHRSFIVNFEHVTDFTRMNINLDTNGLSAYLTRRKYAEFKDAYLLFLESMR